MKSRGIADSSQPVAGVSPEVKSRPILFQTEMVRAILRREKTQTRRTVRFQEHGCLAGDCPHSKQAECNAVLLRECPYGVPGDMLWVKETWRVFGGREYEYQKQFEAVQYRADEEGFEQKEWRPSIFMPRWASRITLEITKVRVERLQQISQADVFAEGINKLHCNEPVDAYQALWESINGKGSWDKNPYVWVITFQKI